MEVVTEITTGDPYWEIAKRLGMSEQTVKNHAAQARQRLGAATNVELYVRLGWLVVPGESFETMTS